MALPLKESKALSDMADLMYRFLPATGSKTWKGHVTFASIAADLGLGDFIREGNKTRIITQLLELTLEYRRGAFEPLILQIVRSGIAYRKKNSDPIKVEEIDRLNGLLLIVGFKFPELWSEDFKESLQLDPAKVTQQHVDAAIEKEHAASTLELKRLATLQAIEQDFHKLATSLDRQSAGLDFEMLLNQLFTLNDLKPRLPFRVVGEQIDGSFEFDLETYLVEAKWTANKTSASQLMVFREKIVGKSAYTRGVFISISGYSEESLEAITRGKQPVFFAIDGFDIMMLIRDQMKLKDFLRIRMRLLAEEGKVWVPFNAL